MKDRIKLDTRDGVVHLRREHITGLRQVSGYDKMIEWITPSHRFVTVNLSLEEAFELWDNEEKAGHTRITEVASGGT